MTTWLDILLGVALGLLLRSLPRIVRLLFARREDHWFATQERRQMLAKDGEL